MKLKRFLRPIIFMVMLTLLLSGCQKEKFIISSHNLEAELTDADFYGAPEQVVRAMVKELKEEYFTDPHGDPEGNAHVSVYELEISEIYKGNCGETLELKIFNGKGMSPDLYLYGEDQHYILEDPIDPLSLEVGKEYILGISYITPEKSNCYGDEGGYIIRDGELWCFTQNENGLYENKKSGLNHKELTIEEIKANV